MIIPFQVYKSFRVNGPTPLVTLRGERASQLFCSHSTVYIFILGSNTEQFIGWRFLPKRTIWSQGRPVLLCSSHKSLWKLTKPTHVWSQRTCLLLSELSTWLTSYSSGIRMSFPARRATTGWLLRVTRLIWMCLLLWAPGSVWHVVASWASCAVPGLSKSFMQNTRTTKGTIYKSCSDMKSEKNIKGKLK